MIDDLIGYEMKFHDGSKWVVAAQDPILGASYVRLHRKGTDGSHQGDVRIQATAPIRNRMRREMEDAGQMTLDAA